MKISVKRSRLNVRKFFLVNEWYSRPHWIDWKSLSECRDRTIYERIQEPAWQVLDRYGL